MKGPGEEGTLEMVWRVVWGMLHADDVGVVSISPRGLYRMMEVIVVACQDFGLTVSEKTTEVTHPPMVRPQLSVERAAN